MNITSWANFLAAAVVLASSLSLRGLRLRERLLGVLCGIFNLWLATL